MLLGEAVLVAEMRVEQVLGEVEADLGWAQLRQHLGRDGDAGADDALHRDGGGADLLGRDDEAAVLVELGFQPL